MGRNSGDFDNGFRSRQIEDSQYLSHAIREGYTGKYEKAKPAITVFDEDQGSVTIDAVPKQKGLKKKRIRQAKGKE